MESVKAKGRITGRVVSQDGTPVEGASVYFSTQAPPYNAIDRSPMPTTTTDHAGCFLLETTAYYRLGYHLLVDHVGLARSSFPVPTIYPNQTYDLGTIVLPPGQIYTGCVVDPSGQPLDGVQVHINEATYRTGHCTQDVGDTLQIRTNAKGRFVTPPLMLAAGTSLQFIHPGFAGHFRRIQVDRVSQPKALADVVLQPETLCRIQFTNAAGEPISGVRVIGAGDGSLEEPVSDDFGIAVIRGLKVNERRWFRAIKDGHISCQSYIEDWDTAIPVRVVLERQAMISGIVVDVETGEPVEIDSIQMCSVERSSATDFEYSSCSITDFRQPRLGVFEIDCSLPGEKHLEVRVDGYQVGEAFTPVMATLQNQSDIRIVVRKATATGSIQVNSRKRVIRGRVNYRGAPVMHGWVACWKLENPCEIGWPHVARGRVVERLGFDTDYTMIEEGRFELTHRPTSQERFLVIESAGLPIRQISWSEFSNDPNTEVSIDIEEPASIRGRVFNVPVGLEGQLWVVAFNPTGLHDEVLSDTDGRFHFQQLGSGTYGLKAGHHGLRDPDIPEIDEMGDPIGFPKDAIADPWKNAVIVTVVRGATVEDVEIRCL